MPPDLSIVLPLVDDRGFGARAIDAWREQTLAPDRCEIVAVASREASPLAHHARQRLRPADRLLILPGADEIGLYQAGAEAARGDFLLFTEAHCLPLPDTAEALLRHLAASGASVATLSGAPIAPNAFARFESRLLHEGAAAQPAEAWHRVSLRGLAVRREIWRAAGGFEVACGRFAEAVLAVRLGRLGYAIEPVESASVRHANCARPRELAAALRPLGSGQAAWRERCERGLEEDFLPPLPEWSERARWHRRHARHLARVAIQALRLDRGLPGWPARAAALRRALPTLAAAAAFGPRAPRAVAAARACLGLAAASRLGGSEERRYCAYRRASSELLRWGVLAHVAERFWLPSAPAAGPLLPSELPDGALLGFHQAERWADGACRWSRPLALLPLALPAGDYRLTIDLRSPVPPDRRCLRLFWNGQALPPGATTFDLRRKWFRGEEQRLAIACAPFFPRRHGLPDDRELGVAVFRLNFEPLG
ncbi:MAG TPA: glycosyltransferase family A protein [Thermoanaerobaculia bacterium]|nr:glycosyltransferase family A protein [Thermoanaerobaculia bacterium]